MKIIVFFVCPKGFSLLIVQIFLANQDPKATHQNEKVYNLDECVKTLLSGVKKCEETKDFVKIVFEGNREKLKLVLH